MSRTDEFKCFCAPIFKLIENEVFKYPDFVKYSPVDERAAIIIKDLTQVGSNIITTDYSSFEASFVPEVMMNAEIILYWYMTQYLPDHDWFKTVSLVLTGYNRCVFKSFKMRILGTRMSGEMCTSLGNGFTNLMAMKFIAYKCGLKSLRGKVEGDDGIFTFYGVVPSEQVFAKIGLTIKLTSHEHISYASFCGIVSDPDELINIKDPIEAILDFGWTNHQYGGAKDRKLLRLLRAKGYSLLFQYNGCPILASLGRYALRISEGLAFKLPYDMSAYNKEKFSRMYQKYKNGLPNRPVGYKTRLLMEKLYKVNVVDQLEIEYYLDNLKVMQNINCWAINKYCPAETIYYYNRYSGLDIPQYSTVFGTNYRCSKYYSVLNHFKNA